METSSMMKQAERWTPYPVLGWDFLKALSQTELIRLRHFHTGHLSKLHKDIQKTKERLEHLREREAAILEEKLEIEKLLCPVKIIKNKTKPPKPSSLFTEDQLDKLNALSEEELEELIREIS